MSENENVKGAVAKLVSDREVILNKGTQHGLHAGMYVSIIDPATESIVDPESGEDLGGFKRIKAVLRITEATERLALARTFRTKRVRTGGGLGTSFANILAEPKYETRVETLQLDPQLGRPIDEEQSAISVGDPFETIRPEDAEDSVTVTLWR